MYTTRLPALLLAATALVACGDDAPPPVYTVYLFDMEGGSEGLRVRPDFTTAGGDTTRGVGTLELRVVEIPNDAEWTRVSDPTTLCEGRVAITESSYSGPDDDEPGTVQIPLGECRPPTEGHYVYTYYRFVAGAREPTRWQWAAAPTSVGGDGMSPGQRSSDAHGRQVAEEERARAEEMRSDLVAYRDSVVLAARALSEANESEVPPCSASGTDLLADRAARSGRFVTERWAQALAAEGQPAPSTEESSGGFLIDGSLAQLPQLVTAGDPAEVHEQLADDGPWLRVVRVATYEEPGLRNRETHDRGVERVNTAEILPGRAVVRLFVVDRREGGVVCSAPVTATSSNQLSAEGQYVSFDQMVQEDLRRNLRTALVAATPPAPAGEPE